MYKPLKVIFFNVNIDVKVHLSKTTRHKTSIFQNNRLENELLQELGEEMDIIISNTAQSKISLFIKFIWGEQHQLEFVTTTVQKSTTVYHLDRHKPGTEFLVVPSCHRLPCKN